MSVKFIPLFNTLFMNEKVTHLEGIGEVRLVRRARSRQLRISVKPSGEVLVSVPLLVSFAKGEAFLSEKKEWVIRARKKLEGRGVQKMPLLPGSIFSTRNFHYKVLPDHSSKVNVRFSHEEQSVIIGYPESVPPDHPEVLGRIRMSMEGVLRYEAKRYLPRRTRELADQLGYSFKGVTVKNNRTNWGSCSGVKNINLNLHLMRLPDRLIDYIIVHELVHTQIPNHGPQFKQRLASHFPDSAALDREIKKFRPELF